MTYLLENHFILSILSAIFFILATCTFIFDGEYTHGMLQLILGWIILIRAYQAKETND